MTAVICCNTSTRIWPRGRASSPTTPPAADPNEVGNAVRNLNDVVRDGQNFVADNQESLGTTSDKLASVTQAVNDSLDDVKQILHVAPTAFQNFLNIYEPAHG